MIKDWRGKWMIAGVIILALLAEIPGNNMALIQFGSTSSNIGQTHAQKTCCRTLAPVKKNNCTFRDENANLDLESTWRHHAFKIEHAETNQSLITWQLARCNPLGSLYAGLRWGAVALCCVMLRFSFWVDKPKNDLHGKARNPKTRNLKHKALCMADVLRLLSI